MLFSVNTSFKNKTPVNNNKKYYKEGYENIEGDLDLLLDYIADGSAFSACYFDGARSKDGFQSSGLVALDFDGGNSAHSIDSIRRRPFVQKYGGLIYTTPSHTVDEPRCRVVFQLESPINCKEKYELLLAQLLRVFSDADQSCKDCSRLFFGNTDADTLMVNNVLDDKMVNRLIESAEKEGNNKNVGEKPATVNIKVISNNDQISQYINRAIKNEVGLLSQCSSGGRHNQLLTSALKMFSLEKSSWAGGVDKNMLGDLLFDAAISNGLVDDDGENSVRKTINDAYNMATEREMPNLNGNLKVQIQDYSVAKLEKAYVLGAYRSMTDENKKVLFSMVPEKYVELHSISRADDKLMIPYWYDKKREDLTNVQIGLKSPRFLADGFPIMNTNLEQRFDRCIVLANVTGATEMAYRYKDLKWDILACPKINDLEYVGEAILNYDKSIFMSSENYPILSEKHSNIPGARHLDVQWEPDDMYKKWFIDQSYLESLIKTAWI